MKQEAGSFIEIVESGLPRDTRVLDFSKDIVNGLVLVLVESSEFEDVAEGGVFPYHNDVGTYKLYANRKAVLEDLR